MKNASADSLALDSNYLPRTNAAIKSRVKYSAKDSIVYNSGTKSASLYNSSKVLYEDMDMQSFRILINLEKHTVNATGTLDSAGTLKETPVFKQGGSEYKIEEVTFNYESKRGLMKQFKTNEGEGFIKGETVKRDEKNQFFINHSYYTTCSEDHPHFYIAADKLKVIPGKKVITGPANLVIEGVRTPLFVPFGIFPLKRGQQSGIIIPAYGNAVGRGFFLRQGGYYLGLGEHMDMQLLGDIFTNTSWQLGTRMNYNYRYRFSGGFNANYAFNKQNNPEDPNYQEFKSFQLTWNHRVNPQAMPGTTFGADVNLIGNQFLAYNSYSNNAFNNVINSSVNFGKVFNKGKQSLTANARASQNLQTRAVSITLPDLSFTVASFQPFKAKSKPVAETWYEKISMNYTGLFQNIVNTKDSLLFRKRSAEDWQKFQDTTFNNGIRHSTAIQNSFNLFKYYTVSVGADYSENWTFKTRVKDWDSTEKRVVSSFESGSARSYSYSARAGISTRWYGMKTFKKGKLVAIRHVMNPYADFSYAPDFTSDRFGFYRTVQSDTTGLKQEKYSRFEGTLYGGPSGGRQGNINFSLDNNLEIKWKKGKDTSERVEKVKILESLRAGASYNIFADSMNLSSIATSARTTLFKNISVIGSANFDPYVTNLIDTGKTWYYQRLNQFSINSGKFATLTNANIGISANLTQDMFKSKDQQRIERRKKELQEKGYSEVNVPWSINLNYTVSYDYRNRLNPANRQLVQNLSFSGNINPTKNWSVNFNSGYDFTLKKISHLGIDLRRDLHCWQFSFNWTPLSAYGTKYFMFNLNVKSSVLQDLKIPKRRDWFDDRRI